MVDRSQRPKLLVVIGTFAHMGGAERQALHLVRHLKRIGSDVEVLAFEDGDVVRTELDAIDVRARAFSYYFRWPKTKRARALAALVRVLRKEIRPDALLPFVGIHSKTIALAWPYTDARFCWWNQQDEGRDLTGTAVEKRILRRVSTVISNSVTGRDFLSRTYDLDPESIIVYNNGTPILQPPPAGGSWRNRESLGDRKVVTMLANISRFKDHDTLFRAWRLVTTHFGAASRPILLLAGHMRETETVVELKTTAFDLGLSSDDIRFLGPVDDVNTLLADSDLVVHSSITEGCPNAVCEAMAMKLAVVATDIPGTRQALGDQGSEWLVQPRDPKELADKIVRLLENDALRHEIGEINLARIASDFTVEGMNRFFQAEIEKGLGQMLS